MSSKSAVSAKIPETAAVTRTDILEAARRIAPYTRRTPVLALEPGTFGTDAAVFLKLEFMQHAGSFKPRGAFNFLLTREIPEAGVIAASGGNHGAAVAYAAQQLGHPAEIFVPTISPPNKVERLRRYGAQVHVGGKDYAEALAASKEHAARTGALPIHAYDDPLVLAGQGTLAMELEEIGSELDTVLAAVGGGGLIGGVAAWFEDRVRVVAVEPKRAPSLYRALEAGCIVDVEVGGVAADSLGARRVGEFMFPIAQRFVHHSVLVSDEQILEAQQLLWQKLRIVTEPGGATALAALTSGVYSPASGERVGVVLCGANTDPAKLA
ncbi:MAG TPA: threonine/serine dehydratase [Terriglobales bacterium]|nr:threonine/serine dehydratase [Terriglobales bacterium]